MNRRNLGVHRPRSLALILVFLTSLVSGCSTYVGIAEFTAYKGEYEKSFEVGNQILDIMAVSERRIFLSANPTSASVFEPELAIYYLQAGDPPGTAAFRRSLASVKAYNDVLYGLASGESAATLSEHLLALSSSLSVAASEIDRVATAASLGDPGLVTILGSIDARLVAVSSVVEFALAYRSREDFRQFVVDYNDDVIALLREIRDGTSIVYPVISQEAAAAFPEVDGERLEAYRTLVAGWVLSLDATIAALHRVSLAIQTDPSLNASIAALTQSAIEINAATRTAREQLVKLSS